MRDHRSLRAWQEARKVSGFAIDAGRDHWRPWAAALFGQLQRSALSVQLNIAEGYALGGPRLFGKHLRIAYGSAVETRDLLDLARDKQLLPEGLVAQAVTDCNACQALLCGLMKRYGT